MDFVNRKGIEYVTADAEKLILRYQETHGNSGLALLGGTLLMSALESMERTGDGELAGRVREYVFNFLQMLPTADEVVVLN
jgi:hypothetical protein